MALAYTLTRIEPPSQPPLTGLLSPHLDVLREFRVAGVGFGKGERTYDKRDYTTRLNDDSEEEARRLNNSSTARRPHPATTAKINTRSSTATARAAQSKYTLGAYWSQTTQVMAEGKVIVAQTSEKGLMVARRRPTAYRVNTA